MSAIFGYTFCTVGDRKISLHIYIYIYIYIYVELTGQNILTLLPSPPPLPNSPAQLVSRFSAVFENLEFNMAAKWVNFVCILFLTINLTYYGKNYAEQVRNHTATILCNYSSFLRLIYFIICSNSCVMKWSRRETSEQRGKAKKRWFWWEVGFKGIEWSCFEYSSLRLKCIVSKYTDIYLLYNICLLYYIMYIYFII